MTISEARRAANRANAARSTGPRTAAGKQAVRLNALKHGLAGRTAVLDDEDASAFADLLSDMEARFQPDGDPEREQVRAMAEALWRMRRGPSLEAVTLQTLIDKEEEGELTPEEVISAPLLLLRIGRYESQIHRSYERARDRLRELQAARPAQSSPRPSGLPGQARQRHDEEICHGRAKTRPSMPGKREQSSQVAERRRGEANFPQFPAENGFVSSYFYGPAHWSLDALMRASCAPGPLLGPPPPASWRFASALEGATLPPAREALPRAA